MFFCWLSDVRIHLSGYVEDKVNPVTLLPAEPARGWDGPLTSIKRSTYGWSPDDAAFGICGERARHENPPFTGRPVAAATCFFFSLLSAQQIRILAAVLWGFVDLSVLERGTRYKKL